MSFQYDFEKSGKRKDRILLLIFIYIYESTLSPSQYGFRKAHSTQHTIFDIVRVNAIQTNMDKRLFSRGVFEKKPLVLLIIIPYCINLNTMAFMA